MESKMRILDVEQGSEEWLAARLRRAVRLDVLKVNNSKLVSVPRPSTATSISALRRSSPGRRRPSPRPMQWRGGTELEPMARAYYELETGNEVVEMGFIKHETLEAGCSPDGFVGEDGGIEIKCPLPHTHVETLRGGVMPSKHIPQVQGCMWITGRTWLGFRFPSPRHAHSDRSD